jgi:7,8-dihydropterin-6-yl-methyl-4-(beta-D-ribofuranosyl)aminobenzene 5'-phosphate synthase
MLNIALISSLVLRGGFCVQKGLRGFPTIIITVVYDNNEYDPRLETNWGFSCVLKGPEKTILFDTGGNGKILLSNMNKLKLDPQEVEVVVLSHIHGDHVGGLDAFLGENPKVTVYSTGELGTWIKEESLIITERGLVIITGCAHPGIVNIVRRAKEILKTNVYLVMGGFHLEGSSEGKIYEIVDAFKREGVEKAGPCHCSGNLARKLFKKAYGEDFIQVGVGKIIEIGEFQTSKKNS